MKEFNKAAALLILSLTSFAFAEKITFSANKMSGVAETRTASQPLKEMQRSIQNPWTSMRITLNFQEKISE